MNEPPNTPRSTDAEDSRVAYYVTDILRLYDTPIERFTPAYQEYCDFMERNGPDGALGCLVMNPMLPEYEVVQGTDWDGIRNVIQTIPAELRELVRSRCPEQVRYMTGW